MRVEQSLHRGIAIVAQLAEMDWDLPYPFGRSWLSYCVAFLFLQAAILTGRRSKQAITNKEVDDSVDRIVAGMEGTPMTDGKAKSLVAYHEVGHAVCGTLTPGHDAVQKVWFCLLILFVP